MTLHRRLLLVLLTLIATLLGSFAVAAPAQAEKPDGWLKAVEPGDEMHVPVLMYRHRHSTPPEGGGKAEVSWERNVAAFNFTHNGVEMVIAIASVGGRYANSPQTVPIDLYRQDPDTGEWSLVGLDGKPFEVNGKAVDWREDSTPWTTWAPMKDPKFTADQELVNRFKSVGLHSEPAANYFLEFNVDGANSTTTTGLSELKPCDSNSQCQANLARGDWVPGLKDMRYISTAPNPKKAKKLRDQGQQDAVDNPTKLKGIQQTWDDAEMPTGRDARALMAQQMFVTPDSPSPPQGAAASALAPGSNPGGIDFSTLQLNYLSEDTGGHLRYSFAASPAGPSVHNVAEGRTAATEASDAFFVWLSMPRSSFWVNLNPNEPDRIVDAKVGTTDVGRIMLQADFQMKKLVGQLIHPDTTLGDQFWSSSDASSSNCIDMRQWIVPAPATVYEHNGGLYIVDAPLQVKMESDYLRSQGEQTSCTNPDQNMVDAFRTLVLPKVVQAVNTAPAFAELRRIYLSRVAAEWYRDRHSTDGALSGMINDGDVSAWPALQQWSPKQVFDQYVNSYKNKEFNVTKQVTRNGTPYLETYTYGGVDFSSVPIQQSATSTFQQSHGDLPNAVQQSLTKPATDQHGQIWLGSTSHPHANRAATSTATPLSPVAVIGWLLGGLCVGGVVLSVAAVLVYVLVSSRRRRRLRIG